MEVERYPLRNSRGQVVSAREYVRGLVSGYGQVDEAMLDELTVQWRAEVNRTLAGSGAAVVGDRIVAAVVESTAKESTLEEAIVGGGRIEKVVYATRLHPATVAAAKTMATPPPLRAISSIGVVR